MITAGTTGLLTATAAGPGRGAARGRPESADGTPEQVHLTWGDDPTGMVVVSWASPGQAVRPRVRIGQRTIPAVERSWTDALTGKVSWTYHATIDGLRPGATYGYAVTADNEASRADPFSATFTTAPGGRAAFRFTSFGDLTGPEPGGPALAQPGLGEATSGAYAVGAVETFQPLFHLLNGGLADTGSVGGTQPPAPGPAWQAFGNAIQASAASRPWMPVPGDLERAGGSGLTAYLTRYTLPSNGVDGFAGQWYSFRVGTVLFVCLSGDDVDGGSETPSAGPQTQWLEATLAVARADALVDWIVVQLHPCPCSSPGSAGRGSDPGTASEAAARVRREWLPLFDTYEVDLVLSGHDHGYERSFPVRGLDAGAGSPHPVTTVDSGVFDTSQGTVHLVLGCGGAPGATTAKTTDWSARRDPATGYGIAVFDVNPGSEAGGQTSVTVRYYHAAAPDPASLDLVGPATPWLGGDYILFETFTLVRPRSDGRRWHLRT